MRISDWSSDVCSSDLDLDLRGNEGLVRKLAQMDMARRIHRDHRRDFGPRIIFAEQRRPEHRRAVKLAIFEQRIDVFIPCDAKCLERGQPGHPTVAGKLRLKWIENRKASWREKGEES